MSFKKGQFVRRKDCGCEGQIVQVTSYQGARVRWNRSCVRAQWGIHQSDHLYYGSELCLIELRSSGVTLFLCVCCGGETEYRESSRWCAECGVSWILHWWDAQGEVKKTHQPNARVHCKKGGKHSGKSEDAVPAIPSKRCPRCGRAPDENGYCTTCRASVLWLKERDHKCRWLIRYDPVIGRDVLLCKSDHDNKIDGELPYSEVTLVRPGDGSCKYGHSVSKSMDTEKCKGIAVMGCVNCNAVFTVESTNEPVSQ